MRNLIRIDEMTVHALGNITGRHAVESVGIDERIALHHLHTILEGLGTELLVVIVLRGLHKEIATHDSVHQHRDAAMLSRLSHKLRQIVVERGAGVGMPVGLGLLVVMSELDDDIVAGLHLLEHLVPAALVDEALRGAAVDGMVVDGDHLLVEVLLQHHRPAALLFATSGILVGCGRIAYHKDSGGLLWHSRCQQHECCHDD